MADPTRSGSDRRMPAPVPVITGLTRVSDLAFTRAGKLLSLENNTGGALAPPSTRARR